MRMPPASSRPTGRAPATDSSRCSFFVSSSFVCESPRSDCTNSITVGTPARATSAASCSGPLGSRCDVPHTSRIDSSASSIELLVEEDRLDRPDPLPRHLDVLLAREPLARLLARATAAARASSAFRWRWSSSCSAVSTTDVTMPGLHTTPPRRAHRALAHLRRDRPDLERELRRAGERVAPLVHRRRAGVRRLALPRDLVALDAERAEHDAERQIQRLEHRAPARCAARDRRRRSRAATRASSARSRSTPCSRSASGQRDAVRVAPLPQLVLVGHRAGRRRRAEERAAEARALLVGPVDEPHGERRRAVGGDPPQHLDAGHDVQAAVEPAAVRHRVDVPADQQRPLGARPRA